MLRFMPLTFHMTAVDLSHKSSACAFYSVLSYCVRTAYFISLVTDDLFLCRRYRRLAERAVDGAAIFKLLSSGPRCIPTA
jgi:hypothetical protein